MLNVFKDLNTQLAELAKYKTKIKSERLKSLLTLTGTKGGLYPDTSPVIDEFENMVTWRKMPTGKPIPQPKYGSLQSFDRVDKVVDDIKREMQKHVDSLGYKNAKLVTSNNKTRFEIEIPDGVKVDKDVMMLMVSNKGKTYY